MSKKTETGAAQPARRDFLKGAAAAGGAAALGLSGSAAALVREEDAPPAPEPTGYRETAHIRAYYRSARG